MNDEKTVNNEVKKTENENGLLEKLFKIKQNDSTAGKEVLAGATTFITMAYILFVNPVMLADAGMDAGAVFTASALSAIVGCVMMAFMANYPIAIAPAMGDNAFFAYAVVIGMGVAWQTAMAAVFIASVLFVLISLTKIRKIVIDAIPQDLKLAMASGIGIFIAFVGLQGAGIIIHEDSTLVTIGSFTNGDTLLSILGFFIIITLIARRVPGAIFVGMIMTAIVGLIFGLIPIPDQVISSIPSLKPTFGAGITNLVHINSLEMWSVVIMFLFVAFFNTTGTLVGLGEQGGFMKDGKMPRIGKALTADAGAMLAGSVFGTTPAAAYVESSSGIAVGGRTGLTALIVGFLFFMSMFFSPLLAVVTESVTAPALIVVGILMASPLKDIQWDRFTSAVPSFLIVVGMTLTFNVSYGIGFGFLAYPIVMLARGRGKEVHPVMYTLFFIFVLLFYILNTIN